MARTLRKGETTGTMMAPKERTTKSAVTLLRQIGIDVRTVWGAKGATWAIIENDRLATWRLTRADEIRLMAKVAERARALA